MPGPVIITKPKLNQATAIRVADEGEIVSLTIGNATVSFHYEDALKLSQLLRAHAKAAKRRAGDTSRHWSLVAVLDGIKG